MLQRGARGGDLWSLLAKAQEKGWNFNWILNFAIQRNQDLDQKWAGFALKKEFKIWEKDRICLC